MASVTAEGPTSTLARGLVVLETVARSHGKGMTLQEVARTLGVNRTNVYRYLITLCEDGWLERDEETLRYRVGWKILQIAGASLQHFDLRTIARPFLSELAHESGLTVHLAVLYRDQIIYIDKMESDSAIQMRSRPGMTSACHCTSMGKAMLSHLPVEQVRSLLSDPLPYKTPNTITQIDQLIEHLHIIRCQGYSIDMEENEEGIGCVGASLFDHDDQVIGALSVSMLYPQLTTEKIRELAPCVMDTARLISNRMGCRHEHWPPPNLG